MEVSRALFCTESPRSTQQIHELFVPLGVETCRTTLPTSVQPVCTATSQRALLVYSLCNVGLLSCGCAVRKRGNQLVMGSLCLVRMVKGSHALGGPCMEVSRALFCTESPRSTQQIHELFVPLGVETCRTTLPTSVQPVCTATSQRALLVYSLCNVGLLSCGCAVRKRGNQLVMGSLCLVRMVKGSHALGGPCMDVSRALFCTESPRSTQQIHELFVPLGVETCRTTLPTSVQPVCTATSQRALLVYSLCNAGLLSCGCAVRKRGNQLVMGSLCLVRMVKGSHALGGPCMDVSRALFCTESPRSTQQIHELFVQLGVETCRTALPQSVRPVCTATSQRALLVCTACVMSVCSPVDVQSASAVTSWSWAVCALSEWSKDPMLLEADAASRKGWSKAQGSPGSASSRVSRLCQRLRLRCGRVLVKRRGCRARANAGLGHPSMITNAPGMQASASRLLWPDVLGRQVLQLMASAPGAQESVGSSGTGYRSISRQPQEDLSSNAQAHVACSASAAAMTGLNSVVRDHSPSSFPARAEDRRSLFPDPSFTCTINSTFQYTQPQSKVMLSARCDG
ncbi:hypothetical protein AK812_SmicGene4718 [Symbiodinium microadriaticum]|uniref:Uncharacterized protein n=1 Tax=Symbiodinium microadriaticum TaxID=2951 RepID=A0A1Q9EVM2_SYMMI|nr:hypothetical protein AK812_SmicGene4718 [Symbiodinium microadriaticum]